MKSNFFYDNITRLSELLGGTLLTRATSLTMTKLSMMTRSPAIKKSYLTNVITIVIMIFATLVNQTNAQTLPGEELTDTRINEARIRREGAIATPTDATATSATGDQRSWLDIVMDTWHAPPMSAQISSDETIIPFGKGGIFVPRMTAVNIEPEIDVFTERGARVGSFESGRIIVVDPGNYRITLGSGSQRQRIEQIVEVIEGRTTPVMPNWAGLVIDVVDEQGITLRGEYEIVRIDEFDPYGRGYGASVELGETVRTWILKPGIYKILGVGEPYNTLTNFVTVRLLPGELTSFLLIQNPDDFRIRGGGTIHLAPTTRLSSNWHFGMNIGVNTQLNIENDHEAEADYGNTSSFTTGFLFDSWIMYRKRPFEWNTRLRLDEGVNVIDGDFETMINSPDRLLMSSTFTWRILNWFGPYARAEFNTKFFGTRIRRGDDIGFIFVDRVGNNYYLRESYADGSLLPDTSQTFEIEPALSPLIFELGAGVSADFTPRNFFELRTRLGFANAYSRYNDRYRVISSDRVLQHHEEDEDPSLELYELINNSAALYPEEMASFYETGPQVAVSALVRIWTFATAEAEFKMFAPVLPDERLMRPDIEFNGTLSWRLSSVLNFDYTYRQLLRRPSELDVPIHTSSHGIWLRLHYSSR